MMRASVMAFLLLVVIGCESATRESAEPRALGVSGPVRGSASGSDESWSQGEHDAILSGFIEAPELELTQVRTVVPVPDKRTLLLGGSRLVADDQPAADE